MQRDRDRRADGASQGIGRRPLALLTVCLLALAAASCTTDGPPSMAAARGASVAFDSIDGPPHGVFRKLVETLNDEAQARRLVVVARDQPALYRVRGYLAASVVGKRTSIAWVWDVYDSEQRRALRITGEEQASGNPRDAWSAADDGMLRRIARDSLDRLATFVAAAEVPPAASGDIQTAMAAGDETSPEASGIFRLLQAEAEPAVAATDAQPALADVPLPRQRPPVAAADRLALSVPSR